MLAKKAISPIIATALLIVVSVVAVISFQSWYQTYSSEIYVKAETDSSDTSNTNIEALIGDQLYFKNTLDENISIKQIKLGNRDCNVSINVSPGVQNISLGTCIDNLALDSNIGDITVITDKEIYTKKHLFKDINIISTPIIQYFLGATYVTAPQGSYYNVPWVFINVSANESIQSCSLNFNGSINSAFTIQNDSCSINQTLGSYGIYNYNVTVVGNNTGVNVTSTRSLNYQLQCVAGNQTFTHTGDYQTFDVPLGCTNFTIKMWGAGGGGSPISPAGRYGGAGGFTNADLIINDSVSNFSVVVGGRGIVIPDWSNCPGNLGGFGGGGNGGSHDFSNGPCAASGGGRSAIRINNVEMVTAGGGGGNGCWSGNGGHGGGLTASAGIGAYHTPGGGGTQVSGGAAGTVATGSPATAGTQFQGGKGGDYDTSASGACSGGGGGGGYYGGGGGSQDSNAGGGSGYCDGNFVTSCTTTAGSARTPPQTGDVDYQAGIGYGGLSRQNGGHGLVVISWS